MKSHTTSTTGQKITLETRFARGKTPQEKRPIGREAGAYFFTTVGLYGCNLLPHAKGSFGMGFVSPNSGSMILHSPSKRARLP